MTNYVESTQALEGRDSARLVKTAIGWLDAIPSSAIALIARIGVAGVFWRSGQTKVNGWQLSDSAIYLFEEEYALPFLPPEFAANMAAIGEHLFPALLIVGIASRFSAAALLAMTVVIQVFVCRKCSLFRAG